MKVGCHLTPLPYKKDIFISTSHSEIQIKRFKECLEKLGFKTTIASSSSNVEEALNPKNSTDNKALILNANSKENDREANQGIIENFYDGIVEVSFPIYFYRDFKIPQLFIAEHGCRDKSTDIKTVIPMDLRFGTQSIFFSEENREDPAKQLTDVLSKESNGDLRTALLEADFKEPSQIEKQCNEFLKNNLFVPAYLQYNVFAIVNFINTTTDSALSQKYQLIVFCWTKKQHQT